jgi:hypothetical protein
MGAYNFETLREHIGHKIVCVCYGDPPANVAVECEDCGCVLMDYDKSQDEESRRRIALIAEGMSGWKERSKTASIVRQVMNAGNFRPLNTIESRHRHITKDEHMLVIHVGFCRHTYARGDDNDLHCTKCGHVSVELSAWELEAQQALDGALNEMVIDVGRGTVTIAGWCGEKKEVDNFSDLVAHLGTLYRFTYENNSPYDGGVPVFECLEAVDEVNNALADYMPLFERMGWDV